MSSSDGLEPTERTDRKGYKRVMLKLGGEMFGGGKVGIDPDVVCLLYTSPSPRDRG